jgi:hypothetical protein
VKKILSEVEAEFSTTVNMGSVGDRIKHVGVNNNNNNNNNELSTARN